MSRGERVVFNWRPNVPTKAIDFVIHVDGEVLPDHYFAYTVHATDVDGETVPPSDSNWAFSKSLNGYFQYSKTIPEPASLSAATWAASAYVHEFMISVVQWSPEEKSFEVKAAAIATRKQNSYNHPVRWEVVNPQNSSI